MTKYELRWFAETHIFDPIDYIQINEFKALFGDDATISQDKDVRTYEAGGQSTFIKIGDAPIVSASNFYEIPIRHDTTR